MPGLVPGIHVLGAASQGVDGRDKPGMTSWTARTRLAALLPRPHSSDLSHPPSLPTNRRSPTIPSDSTCGGIDAGASLQDILG
ncbi:MAG: hypothetical protein EKK33_23045, partial [Bradyrhizobiaceae bacterium]